MSNNKKWWNPSDELPPPSMRDKYIPNPLQKFSSHKHESNSDLRNSKVCGNQNHSLALKSMEERARRLRMNAEDKNIPSVTNIEERLAKLRGVSVEDIRHPRVFVLDQNKYQEDEVENLMRQAKDNAKIDKKWSQDLESTKYSYDLSSIPSTSNADILIDSDTIGNLRDLHQTLKLAKQQSIEAADLIDASTNDKSVDEEIEKLLKQTKQNSVKSKKINKEFNKFFEQRLQREISHESSSESENSSDSAEIDDKMTKVHTFFLPLQIDYTASATGKKSEEKPEKRCKEE
ncbi:unnamed protein product [Thelazia callipaeda]|uniref:Protein TSSC4 n=1 Tax=Thelazia callipaeda TaxID=103827 RepID=A0A0N5CUJ3_THECL|nr:unnamed protein product [Thelazia callipaeda]